MLFLLARCNALWSPKVQIVKRRALCWLAIGFLSAFTGIQAEDWPQWRGPGRDGVWRASGIVDTFSSGALTPKWETPIGAGYSGPTVVGNRVYVMDRQTEPEQTERILCFDRDTGKELWKHSYPRKYTIQYTAGPRASVTIHDGRAFAFGAMGDLHCLDAEKGTVIWKVDGLKKFDIQMPNWGTAGSPLIYEDLVILQMAGKGACFVGLDRLTGETRWTAVDDKASYSSPILIQQGKQTVVAAYSGANVLGLDPKTGKEFWRIAFPNKNMPIGVATPITDGKQLFCTSFYDGAVNIELNADSPTAKLLWLRKGASELKTDALQSIISTPAMEGGYVYGVDSFGEMRCLDLKTGDRLWEDLTATPKSRWSTIHFVKQVEEGKKDRWFLFNERGELLIGELSPKGFKEISRTKILETTTKQLPQRGGVCWSHPAFANQCIFARSDKKLVCISLAKEAK
jgi:outer membrane protein assembly factor BamB